MAKNEKHNYKAIETISVLAFACIVLALLFKLNILLYAALCLLFIGIFLKGVSAVISTGWLKFAHIIGSVNTWIILTLLFFVFLTPIAFLYRLFKGDFMNLKFNANQKSYWHERNHQYRSDDLRNVW